MIKKKKPRRIELDNNLVRYSEQVIEPTVYPSCFEGIIASYADRYSNDAGFVSKILAEWAKTAGDLKVAE